MRRRLLVYANGVVGSRMVEPGIRSYRFAYELAQRLPPAAMIAAAHPSARVVYGGRL